jgi:hypothetical protein
MAGVYMIPETLNRNDSKCSDVKILFFLRSVPHKRCQNYILLKIFLSKNAQSKRKSFHQFVVVFFVSFGQLGVIYDFFLDSYALLYSHLD